MCVCVCMYVCVCVCLQNTSSVQYVYMDLLYSTQAEASILIDGLTSVRRTHTHTHRWQGHHMGTIH